jgi:IclR family transcriptional regulator, pca regulon regulatory protein
MPVLCVTRLFRLCAMIRSNVRISRKLMDVKVMFVTSHVGAEAPTGMDEGATMTIAKADYIEGLAKGLAVLEAFDTERQRLNATLAAQRTGITRAAARRHLLTLAELGYLETDGAHYWLSARVLRLAGSYMATSRLPRTLQPTLNRLAQQTQAAFSAVVLDGAECVIVARSAGVAEPVRHLAHGLHLGARLPAHATSTGRVLLANWPKVEFNAWLKGRELARITPQTEVGQARFKALIEAVRQADHCLARDAHELGIHALAVPLRNMQGHTLAALNVVGTAEQLSDAAVQHKWLPLLLDAARELRPLL